MTDLPGWVRLSCPDCRSSIPDARQLLCERGHRFNAEHGIPALYPHGAARPAPEYAGWITRYYSRRFSRRQEEKTQRLIREFMRATAPRAPVLDVGCFRADKSALFPEHGYVGVDPIDPVGSGAVPAPLGPMVCGFGERLPFADEQFASVMLFTVLDHVSDPEGVVSECHRVLRPDGALCVANQIVSNRDGGLLAMLVWTMRRALTLDIVGLAGVLDFSALSLKARKFTVPNSLESLVRPMIQRFRSVDHWVIEDGYVALVRARK